MCVWMSESEICYQNWKKTAGVFEHGYKLVNENDSWLSNILLMIILAWIYKTYIEHKIILKS